MVTAMGLLAPPTYVYNVASYQDGVWSISNDLGITAGLTFDASTVSPNSVVFDHPIVVAMPYEGAFETDGHHQTLLGLMQGVDISIGDPEEI